MEDLQSRKVNKSPTGFIHEGRMVYFMEAHGKDVSFERWRITLYYASHLAMTHFLDSQREYDEFWNNHIEYCYTNYDEFKVAWDVVWGVS